MQEWRFDWVWQIGPVLPVPRRHISGADRDTRNPLSQILARAGCLIQATRRASSWKPQLDAPEWAAMRRAGKAQRRRWYAPALPEQHSHRPPARLNRARSAITHQLRFVVRSNVSMHAAYLAVMSGQLQLRSSKDARSYPLSPLASFTDECGADSRSCGGRAAGRGLRQDF